MGDGLKTHIIYSLAAMASAGLPACVWAGPGSPNAARQGMAVGAPARDGDIAVREDFDQAERVGTADAYRGFAVRHPDHALAAIARARAIELDRAASIS